MGNSANGGPVASPELPGVPSPARRSSSGPLTVGIPLAEVLRSSSLAGSRVLAGRAGLGRCVQRLNVMEVPDILPWVKPHELLLTTGYPLRGAPESMAGLVTQLDARGLAGIAVKLGRYLDEMPPAVLGEADRLGFPVVRLPDDVAFDDILNQVLTDILNRQAAVLAHADDVHRRLLHIVLAGGGLPEVTAEMAALLGGPVLATTADGRVLAQSGDADTMEAARDPRCFDDTGRFRTELHRNGLQPRLRDLPDRAVVPILAGNLDHGRLVAFRAGAPLHEGDVHALERAATVAALAITKTLAVAAVEEKYRGDFLRGLVSGRAEDAGSVIAHCASLGWDVDRPVVVVVAELDPAPPAARAGGMAQRPVQERFAKAWETVVRPRDQHAPVAGFNHEVVAVLGVPPDGDVERLVHDVVTHVSGDGGGGRRSFSTGVSRVAGDVSEVPRAYEHARKAMLVGRRTRGPGSLAYFDQLGVFRLLSLVEDTAELRGFVTETLGELAARDDADAADLRRTLQVLLESNLNVAETARTLHFHYNTLRYRIGKLERMLGPFTTDPHLRLNLLLALQVSQMPGV